MRAMRLIIIVFAIVFTSIFLFSRGAYAGSSGQERQVKIAVALPVSGTYGFFGKQFVNGVIFSAKQNKNSGTKFLLVNLPPQAGKNVIKDMFRSFKQENIAGVIGPLFSSQLSYFARYSSKYKIPVISPAPVKNSHYDSPYLFNYGMTVKSQVKADLRYAKDKGIDFISAIYPDNPYGNRIASYLNRYAGKYGLTIQNTTAYANKTVDFFYNFSSIVTFQNIGGGNMTKAQENELGVTPYDLMHGITKAKPQIPFDGLFVIGSADKLKLILTQLVYYNITGVHLFGLSDFDSPHFLGKYGFYMQGAVFPNGFFVHSSNKAVKDFVSKYSKYYGHKPNILSAEGYDIGDIMIKAALLARNSQKQPTGRSVYKSLLNIKVFKGVCGISRLFANMFKKGLYLFKLENNTIVILNSPFSNHYGPA